MHGEHEECGGGCGCGEHHMHGPMHKEFKLAKLEKKEKMLQAKIDFVRKIKGIIEKSPDSEDGK